MKIKSNQEYNIYLRRRKFAGCFEVDFEGDPLPLSILYSLVSNIKNFEETFIECFI